MGSHQNLKNFGDGGPLARQTSIYSLTFDELQNTFGGLGKDFGSMNMDELLRNILFAEETQTAASVPAGEGGVVSGGNLQKQGSLTLPRTLSSKTVVEVWKYLVKETDGAKDGEANLPRRESRPSLGATTLEEFLLRAGIVREDMHQIGMSNNGGFVGNNSALARGFQQANTNNRFLSSDGSVLNQIPRPPLNMNGCRSSSQQQKQPLFPKQQTAGFAPSMHLVNTAQLTSPGARRTVVGIGSTGMDGLESPTGQISSDGILKNSVDAASSSSVPYIFGQGRKCGVALEKVVERRQRRMVKNRESAARSRARKQAYTLELEAELTQLKEMNRELQKKLEETMKIPENQMLENVNRPSGGKRRCLRRTMTNPW